MDSRNFRRADLSVVASFWSLAVAGGLSLTLNFLGRYENELFPVISGMEVTAVEQQADTIRISGTMQVNRACSLEEVLLYTGDGREPDVERERLYMRVITEPVDLTEGQFSWGPWEIARPTSVEGPHLVARMTHRCHALFDTTGVVLLLNANDLFRPGSPT